MDIEGRGPMRHQDAGSIRMIEIVAPVGRTFSPEHIEALTRAFEREKLRAPELLREYMIHLGGRLAVSLTVSGSEAVLQQKIPGWSARLYGGETPPVGHQWSIDRPGTMSTIVIQ